MAVPNEKEYKSLSKARSEKPGKSWADFANNFLFWFFEGQSFSIWVFVSGLLIVLYGRYVLFPKTLTGQVWFERGSLSLLLLLIISTLYKTSFLVILTGWEIN